MSIGRFGYCTSLLKRRQRYAIHCNFRNLGGESNGRKEGRSASGVLKYEVLKGDLKEGEDETKVYSSSDFQDHRGMQLVFLGTSSAVPTITRNTSCIAVRLDGTVYLFDCGEGAQKQFFQTPFRQRGVDKIFITHMHGDHIFGLPGLITGIAVTASRWKQPLQIFGPQGIRNWLRVTLNSSYGRVRTKYKVHELILEKSKGTNASTKDNECGVQHQDELPGRDIYCSEDGLWHLHSDKKYKVQAGLLKHSIPCWGYVVEEHTRPGRFIVERAEENGVKPGHKRALLQKGQSVLVNGKMVKPVDVLGCPRRGRKVVILGDTYDPSSLQSAASGADTVIHECTLLEEDVSEVLEKAHSTATMAGNFARLVNAHSLILTHFGGKFNGRGDRVQNSVDGAKRSFGKDVVLAARDFLAVTIRQTDESIDQV